MLNGLTKQANKQPPSPQDRVKVVLGKYKGMEGVFHHKSGEISSTLSRKTPRFSHGQTDEGPLLEKGARQPSYPW